MKINIIALVYVTHALIKYLLHMYQVLRIGMYSYVTECTHLTFSSCSFKRRISLLNLSNSSWTLS